MSSNADMSELTPPTHTLPRGGMLQVPRRIGSVLSRLLRRDCVSGAEEKEAELHLYAVSPESRLYLHLRSAWNSVIIVSDGTNTPGVTQQDQTCLSSLIVPKSNISCSDCLFFTVSVL